MALFFTLDRLQSLKKGQVITLKKFDNISPPELQNHVDAMFPDGVSTHGDRYFLKNDSGPDTLNSQIELFFEYVRRAYFPEKPSRFQSVFGFEKLKQVVSFRERFGNGQGVIWKIKADRYFKADMSLLYHPETILVYSYFAHKYWAGEPGPDPLWEVLLIPPVQVVKKCIL